jgi:hypothetical protein
MSTGALVLQHTCSACCVHQITHSPLRHLLEAAVDLPLSSAPSAWAPLPPPLKHATFYAASGKMSRPRVCWPIPPCRVFVEPRLATQRLQSGPTNSMVEFPRDRRPRTALPQVALRWPGRAVGCLQRRTMLLQSRERPHGAHMRGGPASCSGLVLALCFFLVLGSRFDHDNFCILIQYWSCGLHDWRQSLNEWPRAEAELRLSGHRNITRGLRRWRSADRKSALHSISAFGTATVELQCAPTHSEHVRLR